MKDKTHKKPGDIHTTIPVHYWYYAQENKLSWTRLLKDAIEKEMDEDPEILEARIEKRKKENNADSQKLEIAKRKKQLKEERLQNLNKPSFRSYGNIIKEGDDK